jgi:hypothetical protein
METPTMTDPDPLVIVAASAAAAQRLAQRADAPADLGPPADPARAAAGWRRWGFPRQAPRAAVADAAVLAKVRKLLALAGNGGATEGEASNAAAAAQRLIEAHRLDTALLDDGGAAETPPPPDEPVSNAHDPLDQLKSRVAWRGALASGIARANGCRIYWWAGRTIRVIGAPTRVASVRTLYAWLSREVDRLGGEAARGNGRSYGHAWRVGCAERLAERLRQAARDGAAEAKAKAIGSGVALVRVERALARVGAETEGARVAAWIQHNLKLTAGRRTSIGSTSGYAAGRQAGDRIRLTGHAALGRGDRGRIGGGS